MPENHVFLETARLLLLLHYTSPTKSRFLIDHCRSLLRPVRSGLRIGSSRTRIVNMEQMAILVIGVIFGTFRPLPVHGFPISSATMLVRVA